MAQGLPNTFDLAASWIASAASAIAAGVPPPALEDGVVRLDPWTLETTRHPISIAAGAAERACPTPIHLVAVPAGVTVEVVENSANLFHLVLPLEPTSELSDEALDKVAGGRWSAKASQTTWTG
ncbi:MAG: hypothetical protein U1E60_28475 [Reyranellaceae bacterium]